MQLPLNAADPANRRVTGLWRGTDDIAATGADRGAGFASLLRQSQSAAPQPPAPIAPPATPPQPAAAPPAAHAAAPAPRPDAAAAPSDAAPADADADAASAPAPADDTAAAPPQTPADAARAQLRARLRVADGGAAARSAKTAAPPAAETPVTDTPAATDKRVAADTAGPAAVDPTALALPAAAVVPPATTHAEAGVADGDRADGREAAAAARRGEPLGATTADAARPAAATPVDPAHAAGAGADFAGLLAAERGDAPAAPPAHGAAVDGVAASSAPAAAFGPVPAAGTAASPSVDVPTPVGSPDFAEHLGVQVSVLAKDGIQQAELHLNPADMGPVSVQITLDGTQARIDFGADVAATRHAIEAGLPQLAGALADAGFTLAGGGVSQHAPGHGQGRGSAGNGGERSARGDGTAPGPVEATTARRDVRIGGLDLYA